MTPKERQLWLARHKAPANMRLVTDLELTVITNGLHEVQAALKLVQEENAKLTDHNQRLQAKAAELTGAIALGQENCDDAYNDLRAERDEARSKLAKLVAHLKHENDGWTRPGKTSGISATWNKVPGRFYVFSSGAPPFEPNHVYRPWHVFALLEHAGDFHAAAKALAAAGYGVREQATPAPTLTASDDDDLELITRAAGGTFVDPHEMPWDSLLAFDGKHDADCLMGNRFLGRTGSLVIVAPSGIGKSVLALQLGACAALGRPFFGLRMIAPLRVLYCQAEDDIGDVSESVQGFVAAYKLAPGDVAQLRDRLRIVRWNDVTGPAFLARLRAEHARHPFDLVIVNPLFSFAGCNVSEQKELSPFLLNGLNPILNDTRAACVLLHHTNKPTQDERKNPTAADQYSGSSELTNWARAYGTLQQVKSAGEHVFKMGFPKRGRRTGIVDADGKPLLSVYIRHAERGLCWLPSDYVPEQNGDGKFKAKFNMDRARRLFDGSLPWNENEAAIAADQGMTGRAIRDHRRSLEAVCGK